ncbi:YjcZ family sporulation protein, partial [Oceanobacillus sp. CF4.6]|uniref:YjcZ family sporulation protein n=1 Tax=Oceanobacillus sp. CF4.6 TaxID=3373080 RepID=UPI003EE5172A
TVEIYDITNPTAPVRVGEFNGNLLVPVGLAIFTYEGGNDRQPHKGQFNGVFALIVVLFILLIIVGTIFRVDDKKSY